MTVFAVEIERDVKAEHFMEATGKNFIFTDLFGGRVKRLERGELSWYVFSLNVPLAFPFRWMGAGFALAVVVFSGVSWWLAGSLLFLLPDVVKSRWYWYARLVMKLRKYGYKGSVRLVGSEELSALVVE